MEIRLGDRFSSYDEFEAALRRLEVATNAIYVKRSTKSVDIANYSRRTAKLDAKLKFFHAVFTCKKGGPIRTASRGLRHRQTTKRNCPAHISISAKRTTQELEVTSLFLEHNHNPFVLDADESKKKGKAVLKKNLRPNVIFANLNNEAAGDGGSKKTEGRSLLKRNLTASVILENIHNETAAAEMLLLSPEQASLACGSNSELAASAEVVVPASGGEEQVLVEQTCPVMPSEQPNRQLIGLESVEEGGKEHRGWTEEKAAFLVDLVKTRISEMSPRIFGTKKAMWEDVAKYMNARFPESTFTPLNVAGKWKMLERCRKKEEEENRNMRPVVSNHEATAVPGSAADIRQLLQAYTVATRKQEENAERRHRDQMAMKRKKLELLERLVQVAEKNALITPPNSSSDNYDAGTRARVVQETVEACLLLL